MIGSGDTVELGSSRFGKISYMKSDIISMTRGLLGFEGFKRFVVVSPKDQQPFRWLQSIDDPDLAFLALDPLQIRPDYKIEISPKDMALLEAKDGKNLDIYILVSIPKGRIEAMTANMQAPIVINKSKMRAVQLLINDSGFVTQYPIFNAIVQRLADNI
jgi:flagellar assembly factor FliW